MGDGVAAAAAHLPEQEMPVHLVTLPLQLPRCFVEPNAAHALAIGLDCEGVDLARHGRLCIMQLAFQDAIYLVDAVQGGDALMQACKPALESPHVTKVVHDCKRDSEALYFQHGIKLNNVFDTQIAHSLIELQQGRQWIPDDCISFVDLLADAKYCVGVAYDEKDEVRSLLRKDPEFWTHRPLTNMMKRAAADDVRFLLRIHRNMVQRLDAFSAWELSIRSSLFCRCFCGEDDGFANWPALPAIPGTCLAARHEDPEEVLAVVDVPKGRMGRIIGRKGASIVAIKESCRANIFIGGTKGPPDKASSAVFVIGPLKEVRKAEAILRGKVV
ncbi:hypothetical protein SELMODRAFT_104837 [Selaginella moellendorffii]|uniref:3'-5' exonuclease domain-containing protein n=1 Tax=Selaginella moellendorffii TaxID=88036 RepID=D8RZE6_SELML|nr:hypothetical protein SELMODRAFT_104837 [Selaginella moellendorffii]